MSVLDQQVKSPHNNLGFEAGWNLHGVFFWVISPASNPCSTELWPRGLLGVVGLRVEFFELAVGNDERLLVWAIAAGDGIGPVGMG
ncbi:MAG: hypothetical protein CMJ78_00510 [Planctomycetaceae bacterium]|nr:hypothetical protein [Planctomycetaceae bacterium]